MRIALYVPQVSYLEPGYSGDHVFARSLVRGLQKRGHQVNIVSRLDPADFGRGPFAVRGLVAEAISVRRRMSQFSPDAWLIYAPTEGRPDLFGWWQRPRRYVLLAAHAPQGRRSSANWRSAFLTLAHKRSLARADKITAFRHPSADRLRSFGVGEQRLCILPPAAEAWDWMPSQEEARRHLALPLEAPVILCVGRFSIRKRDGQPRKTEMLLDLLAAVAPLPPEIIVVIVGDGPGRQRLEEAAAKLKPEGRVRLVGLVDHADLNWYYAACDLFAFPHPKDESRVSVLEAQYCGRPVVTMRTRSAELTVDAGSTGMLANDLKEFREQIAALACERTRCASMGQAARDYIARHHSIETRVRQFEDLLFGRQPEMIATESAVWKAGDGLNSSPTR